VRLYASTCITHGQGGCQKGPRTIPMALVGGKHPADGVWGRARNAPCRRQQSRSACDLPAAASRREAEEGTQSHGGREGMEKL
jgi:hypothetical protein